MTDVDRLSSGKYLSLTTFRRTGDAVATPVWVTRDRDHLYVITDAGSGKVKRLRHTSRVLLAPCDARGTLTGGQVEGTAQLLDDDGTAMVRGLVKAKYGLMYHVMKFVAKVQGVFGASAPAADSAVVVTPDDPATGTAPDGDGDSG